MAADPRESNPHWNKPAPHVKYFTPNQTPIAGTFVGSADDKQPKVFTPVKVRGLSLPNRVMLSPLCQYSADNGAVTDWHVAHLGGVILRGVGLVCVEATAVTPNGRISPEDTGLWDDAHIAPLKRIVDFAHAQGQKVMIQLAHAGRKASTVAPFLSGGATATKEIGGWPDNVWAPSAIAYSDAYPSPKEMTKADIAEFKEAWKKAVLRALEIGFDAIEIHNAHGYLLHEFVSGASNQRTDEYGGSFENRTRLTLEIVNLTRSLLPADYPLWLRISGTDWLESDEDKDLAARSWTLAQTQQLSKQLAAAGVDVIDVSSGGLHPRQKFDFSWQAERHGRAYQAPLALGVKEAVGDAALVSAVGAITGGQQAENLLQDGLDLVVVGRTFQKNPGLVFAWADELEVDVRMPNQIQWAFAGRAKKNDKK